MGKIDKCHEYVFIFEKDSPCIRLHHYCDLMGFESGRSLHAGILFLKADIQVLQTVKDYIKNYIKAPYEVYQKRFEGGWR